MTEPHRFDAEASRATADRDGRTEALLVEGLDRYFAGDYEDAIHVWTRVLFLDRAHPSARAYIERARTALGERQRRADEMLQATVELIASADFPRARSVLAQAARVSGDDEGVARLWSDLERAERARGAGAPTPQANQAGRRTGRSWRPRAGVLGTFVTAGALGTLLMATALSPAVREWVSGSRVDGGTGAVRRFSRPVVLSGEDVALLRARTLRARGRLADALRALDRVTSDESRGVADALRVELQGALLSTTGDRLMLRAAPGPAGEP